MFMFLKILLLSLVVLNHLVKLKFFHKDSGIPGEVITELKCPSLTLNYILVISVFTMRNEKVLRYASVCCSTDQQCRQRVNVWS